MMPTRRYFLGAALSAGTIAYADILSPETNHVREAELLRIADQPILRLDKLQQVVRIQSLELLRNGSTFIARVRTTSGDEGIAVANGSRLRELYPIFVRRVAPFFVGKDARQLETLLTELYRTGSNYKLQGIGLWAPHAAAEMAILDLLGKLSDQSLGELLGGVKRTKIAVYRASSNRGNTVEQEIEHLKKLAEETGGSALKFRLGGRMSQNADSRPGRTESLIPKVREAFGREFTLYADSNSSYDVENAIRVGRLMEEYDYGFFEEPCPFDHLWETKQVADALDHPRGWRRARIQYASFSLVDRKSSDRRRATRSALLRRLPANRACRAHGQCDGHTLHCPHVRQRSRLCRYMPSRIVY